MTRIPQAHTAADSLPGYMPVERLRRCTKRMRTENMVPDKRRSFLLSLKSRLHPSNTKAGNLCVSIS